MILTIGNLIDWESWAWFNFHRRYFHIGKIHFKFFNCFYRNGYSLTSWGFGLLQIKSRHLLMICRDENKNIYLHLLFIPVFLCKAK